MSKSKTKRNCAQLFKRIDTFGVGFNFLSNGEDTYKTLLGASFSLIAYICVVCYMVYDA